MCYTIEKVRKEFHSVCASAGITITQPIEINNRLTATLGRVISTGKQGSYEVKRIEFSGELLRTATDKSIHDVICHEAAHAIVIARTHTKHGHDNYFKSVCAEIGTSADKIHTTVERTVSDAEIYKYQIFCPTCDTILPGGYKRMCKTIQYINMCTCNTCGKGNLKVIQNW